MTPRLFRELPRPDQIEMMVHLDESDLRKAHLDHTKDVAAKDAEKKKPGPARR